MTNEEVGPERTKEDRKQIGLPRTAFPMLEELVEETPWFRQQLDAYRVAISVALARNLKPSKEEPYETKFSTSSVDPDRELRELVLTLAPECGERPYDYAQRLANKGVRYLHNELVKRGRPLPEVLVPPHGLKVSAHERE
jgi:hypothetical protein